MYYVRLKGDSLGRRWKVREAVSLQAAVSCINWAMVSGRVGGRDVVSDYVPGKSVDGWPKRVIADVVRVNSDNSEAIPYQTAY